MAPPLKPHRICAWKPRSQTWFRRHSLLVLRFKSSALTQRPSDAWQSGFGQRGTHCSHTHRVASAIRVLPLADLTLQGRGGHLFFQAVPLDASLEEAPVVSLAWPHHPPEGRIWGSVSLRLHLLICNIKRPVDSQGLLHMS